MVKMYSLVAGAGCCLMSVAQMLKLHFSFMKVSVAVVAGADKMLPSLVSKCLEVLFSNPSTSNSRKL